MSDERSTDEEFTAWLLNILQTIKLSEILSGVKSCCYVLARQMLLNKT